MVSEWIGRGFVDHARSIPLLEVVESPGPDSDPGRGFVNRGVSLSVWLGWCLVRTAPDGERTAPPGSRRIPAVVATPLPLLAVTRGSKCSTGKPRPSTSVNLSTRATSIADVPSYETLDPLYGPILLERDRDGSRVTVCGESIPTASINRTSDAAVRSDVPIGTRDGGQLRLMLGGNEFDVRPSPGRFSRRSYRVEVTGHGHSWLFTPASPTAHRLVQGSRYTGHNEIGIFTSDEDEVRVELSQEISVAGAVAHKVDSTPLDCALGYLLTAAFGTGAQLMLAAIVTGATGALFPG